MEKKHDLTFCPECGSKLDGDEIICPVCGYKLAELHPVQKTKEPVVPPPPIVAETPVNTFCPNCGSKIESNELFCNGCGFRIADSAPINNDKPPVIPPSPLTTETPNNTFCPNCGMKTESNELFCNSCGYSLTDSASANNEAPPVDQPFYQQPQQPYYPPMQKKKGMGAGWWIVIVLLILIVFGGGTVAFLQYNGSVDIAFLRDYIPAKDSQSATTTSSDPTRYYVVHSFGIIGTKWYAIISDVIVSRQKFNNEEGAKNQFKLAIEHKFPQDYHNFYDNVIANQYMTYPAAQSAHTSILRSYGTDSKNYTIQTITFGY